MSYNGVTPSNPELDAAILAASQGASISENVEAMRQILHDAPPVVQAPTDSSMPAAHQFKLEREIKFAPSSGRRTLVIRADNERDLQALEDSILYGK